MSFLGHIPLYYGKVIIVLLYVLLAFWVFRHPRAEVFQDAPNPKAWRDLRLWAFLLIGLQIGLYLIF